MITTELILRIPEDILYTLNETKNDFINYDTDDFKNEVECIMKK